MRSSTLATPTTIAMSVEKPAAAILFDPTFAFLEGGHPGKPTAVAACAAYRYRSCHGWTEDARDPRSGCAELKCLRKIRPLLSRLRNVASERDRASIRRLFMKHYCALILMSLLKPAVQSLRDLQRARTLDKVRRRLGVTRRETLWARFRSLSQSTIL
jgi:hypothetical protein